MTPFSVISISQSYDVTQIRSSHLTYYDKSLFVEIFTLLLQGSFSPYTVYRKRMDGLTTGCDGNSLTKAMHFYCFIIFLKSMQSKRFAPLFTSLWRYRLERLFSSCNTDWLKVPAMCSISMGIEVCCNCKCAHCCGCSVKDRLKNWRVLHCGVV